MKRKIIACFMTAAMLFTAVTPVCAATEQEPLLEISEAFPTGMDFSDAEFVEFEEVQDEYGISLMDADVNPMFPDEIDTPEEEIALMKYLSAQVKEHILQGESSFDVPIIGDDIYAPTDNLTMLKNLTYYCPYIDKTTIAATSYSTVRSGKKYFYSFYVTVKVGSDQAVQWVNTIDSKLNELYAMLDSTYGQGNTEIDEALVLHDYMASHYEYDTSYSNYYPAQILTQKKGVCQAYAYLFQYVMNQRGYNCYTVSSDALDHAWNLLEVDGNYYNIDITWDDPLNDRFGQAKHENFLFSDSKENHYGRNLTELAAPSDYEAVSGVDLSSVSSPVVIRPDGYYYVSEDGLNKASDGTNTVVDPQDMIWPVLNGNGYWMTLASGLGCWGDLLYYNTATDLICFDPATGLSSSFAKVNTPVGYCYGSVIDNGTISYALKESPNTDVQEIFTADLPEAPHMHRYDDASFIWEEDGSAAAARLVCADCDEVLNLDADITSVTEEEVSCSNWGYVTYSASVTVGKKIFKDTLEVDIPPLDHIYDDGIVTQEPAKDACGYILYTCVNCGNSYYEELEYEEKPCIITAQPEDVSASVNQTVSFHVEAENVAAYQWQYSKNGGVKWINCSTSGNTTDTITLKVSTSNSANLYRCLITGFEGEKLITETARVDVLPGVVIILNPKSNAVALGEYAEFKVETENAASFQWQYSKDGAHWYNSGAEGNTTDTLLVKGEQKSQGNRYRCKVTGIDGNMKKSLAAAMIVMTVAPKDSSAKAGEMATYSLKAEGIEAYQWQYSKDGGQTWYKSGAEGAASDTVSFVASKSNRSNIYRCKLTTPDEATAFTKPVGFSD